jgi:hypothetical protein
MAYASKTGALKVSSRACKVEGASDEEHDLIKRILGAIQSYLSSGDAH